MVLFSFCLQAVHGTSPQATVPAGLWVDAGLRHVCLLHDVAGLLHRDLSLSCVIPPPLCPITEAVSSTARHLPSLFW